MILSDMPQYGHIIITGRIKLFQQGVEESARQGPVSHCRLIDDHGTAMDGLIAKGKGGGQAHQSKAR